MRQISDVTSITEQLQVMKHTSSELMSSKNNLINSESSEDKVKSVEKLLFSIGLISSCADQFC